MLSAPVAERYGSEKSLSYQMSPDSDSDQPTITNIADQETQLSVLGVASLPDNIALRREVLFTSFSLLITLLTSCGVDYKDNSVTNTAVHALVEKLQNKQF